MAFTILSKLPDIKKPSGVSDGFGHCAKITKIESLPVVQFGQWSAMPVSNPI